MKVIRKFQCDECGRYYKDAQILTQHEQKYHRAVHQANPSPLAICDVNVDRKASHHKADCPARKPETLSAADDAESSRALSSPIEGASQFSGAVDDGADSEESLDEAVSPADFPEAFKIAAIQLAMATSAAKAAHLLQISYLDIHAWKGKADRLKAAKSQAPTAETAALMLRAEEMEEALRCGQCSRIFSSIGRLQQHLKVKGEHGGGERKRQAVNRKPSMDDLRPKKPRSIIGSEKNPANEPKSENGPLDEEKNPAPMVTAPADDFQNLANGLAARLERIASQSRIEYLNLERNLEEMIAEKEEEIADAILLGRGLLP